MKIKLASVFTVLALLLAGCSSSSPLTAENASSRLMTTEDFDFPVSINMDTWDVLGERYPVFGYEDCQSDAHLAQFLTNATLISERSFKQKGKSKQLLGLTQTVIEFADAQQADKMIQIVENGVSDEQCVPTQSDDVEQFFLYETGSSQEILGVGGQNSYSWSSGYSTDFDGPSELSTNYTSYIAVGNLVLRTVSFLVLDQEGIPLEKMKNATKLSIQKMIG